MRVCQAIISGQTQVCPELAPMPAPMPQLQSGSFLCPQHTTERNVASFLHEDIVHHAFQFTWAVSLIFKLFIPRHDSGLLKMWVSVILLSLHFPFGRAGIVVASHGSGGGTFFLILLYPISSVHNLLYCSVSNSSKVPCSLFC